MFPGHCGFEIVHSESPAHICNCQISTEWATPSYATLHRIVLYGGSPLHLPPNFHLQHTAAKMTPTCCIESQIAGALQCIELRWSSEAPAIRVLNALNRGLLRGAGAGCGMARVLDAAWRGCWMRRGCWLRHGAGAGCAIARVLAEAPLDTRTSCPAQRIGAGHLAGDDTHDARRAFERV